MFRRNDQALYKAKPKVKDFKLRLIFKIVCYFFFFAVVFHISISEEYF